MESKISRGWVKMKMKTGNQNMFYNNSKTLGCTSNAELSASESIKTLPTFSFPGNNASNINLTAARSIGRSSFG